MLYLVPTPVGNLEDITLRALEVLRTVDYILAEDTRVTGKLLSKYEISNTLRAYHAHNEHRATALVIEDLKAGQNIALVSDAGTPGLSDPGFLLVNACHEAGIPYTCLPGATSLIPALVMSGFPVEPFRYEGFLPHKKGRSKRWKEIASSTITTVVFESPHRLTRFLREAQEHLDPDREIAVVREISKLHEEVHRGTPEELRSFFDNHPGKAKGEITIVIERL
jgi:16S rRNA (cytidine1402-2'-O)-methyltransferase